MKVVSLSKNPARPVNATFTRVSNTEGQIHNFDGDGWSNPNVYSVEGSKEELDIVEAFYAQMIEAHPSKQPEFITVTAKLAVANTVLVEAPPASEIRPVVAQNALAAPNMGLVRRAV